MKKYEGKFWLFHGVSSELGIIDHNESRLITQVFKQESFLDACKSFYLSAMETTQRYLPQRNGETVSVLSDFSNEEGNLINLVSESLKEITTQNSDIKTYKSQGNHETGIIIRLSLHEKLFINKYGVEKYAFIEDLRRTIHPHLYAPNEEIQNTQTTRKKHNSNTPSPYDLSTVKKKHKERNNERRDPKKFSPYDLSTHGGFRKK